MPALSGPLLTPSSPFILAATEMAGHPAAMHCPFHDGIATLDQLLDPREPELFDAVLAASSRDGAILPKRGCASPWRARPVASFAGHGC